MKTTTHESSFLRSLDRAGIKSLKRGVLLLALLLGLIPGLAVQRVAAQGPGSVDYELFLEVTDAVNVTVTITKPDGTKLSATVSQGTNVNDDGRDWGADTDTGQTPTPDPNIPLWDLEGSTLYKIEFEFENAGSSATPTPPFIYYYFNCEGNGSLIEGFYCIGGNSGHNDIVFVSEGGKIKAYDDRVEMVLADDPPSFDEYFSGEWVIPHYVQQYCEDQTVGCGLYSIGTSASAYFLGTQDGPDFNLPSEPMIVPINRDRVGDNHQTWTFGEVNLYFAPDNGMIILGASGGRATTVNAIKVEFHQVQSLTVSNDATFNVTDSMFKDGHLIVESGGTAILTEVVLDKTMFTIQLGGTAEMTDPTEVRLGSSFHAKSGSTFHAHLGTGSGSVRGGKDSTTDPRGGKGRVATGQPEATLNDRIEARAQDSQPSLHQTLEAIPDAFSLSQNYPNPFNPITTIAYTLPEDARVMLKVYDMLGREIATLVDGFQQAGYRSAVWEGRDATGMPMPSGTYFYRFIAGDQVLAKKMILLK